MKKGIETTKIVVLPSNKCWFKHEKCYLNEELSMLRPLVSGDFMGYFMAIQLDTMEPWMEPAKYIEPII